MGSMEGGVLEMAEDTDYAKRRVIVDAMTEA